MGLEEVGGKRLHASKLEKGDHVVKLRSGLPAKTFEKLCRTIDEAIEEVVSSKSERLVWLNTGSLVGDRANVPHASHRHLWESVQKLFPSETDPVQVKHRRITVGSLIKWRVALRPEDWLVHYRETNKTDIVSGDLIKASEFWIKPAGVVLTPPPPKRGRQAGPTVEDLMKKFNKGG